MRKPIIIGNWKMNMGISEGLDFLKKLEKVDFSIEVGLGIQAISLISMKQQSNKVFIGAQNVHEQKNGAYTGEISCDLLKEANIDFAIIGHSERRQYYNETDNCINKKAQLLLQDNILPVICVGETLVQYEASQTKEVVEKQIEITCKDLDVSKCVIAYEPVWAIGTGKSATFEIAQNICSIIRNKLATMYTQELADKVRIQYGGSVNENNISELMACPDIDGALVGGASLKIESFMQLVNY